MSSPATATLRRRKPTREQLTQTFGSLREELVGTLYYLLDNYEDAQDATQETFLKCWRSRRTLRKVRNLRAWIFRIGLNAAKDLQRNAWRRRFRPLEAAPPGDPFPRRTPVEDAIRGEELDQLHGALHDLRREEKEVFLLRQNGDLTYEEIAQLCRRPVGTIKTQMRAALHKLRGVLRPAPAGLKLHPGLFSEY
jgi:RNA polymerase sigma-70 factor (ECF subfamily)